MLGGLVINVILVHGFNKNSKDMRPLEQNLQSFGYQCYSPDLQLTFKEIEFSSFALEKMLDEMVKIHLKKGEKIHLVGHSTGGLVIRKLISDTKYRDKIGRCVLIASPNKGSKLANIAGKMKPYAEVFKTLKSLTYDGVEKLEKNHFNIEMAAIAGNKSNLLLGKLIRDVNDGRVELDSVYFSSLKDFLVLPYGHKEIHHKKETARWVDLFLKTGKFK